MRCPWCGRPDTKVVDSRPAEEGASVRRRRECTACGRRFTTFERSQGVALRVIKRDGSKEPYDRSKVSGGVRKAIGNRPVTEEQVENLADSVEERLRRKGPEETTQEVGLEVSSARVGAVVLERLRALDEVAYVRFASVYKGFDDPGDFEREVLALSQADPPQQPPPPVD